MRLVKILLFLVIVMLATSGNSNSQVLSPKQISGVLYTKGAQYAMQGEFEKAQEQYQKALKVDSSHELAAHSLDVMAEVVAQKIDRQSALNTFKSGYNVGKGEYDLAISQGSKAIALSPSFAEAYNSRGIAYAKSKQDKRAINDYSKAIELNPRRAFYYKNRGLAHRRQGHYDSAIQDYSKGIKLTPKNGELYNNRAIAHYYNHEYGQAQRDVLQAQSLGYQVHPGFLAALSKAQK